MTKSMRIGLIMICIVLIIFLIGTLVWGIAFHGASDFTDLEIVKEEEFQNNELEEIVIKAKKDDVFILESSDENIHIIQKASKKVKEKELFLASFNNGTLKIESQKKYNFCIGFCFWKDMVYEIYLPSSYMKKLTVEAVSGDVINSLEQTLSRLKITTVSGDIELKNKINASSIYLKSISGDIMTTYLESPEIEMTTVSGDIDNEFILGEEIKIKSISGDVENKWLKGSIDISTTSGEVELDYFNITGESKITSVSGDIEVMLDPSSSVRMSADSISGDIHLLHTQSTLGDGTHSLYFKTTSGDIDVRVAK